MENSANILNLKNLNLEAELEIIKNKLKWSESTAERSTRELKDAESTHGTELETDREIHYAHLKEVRMKHAREQEVALSETKAKYTQQIAESDTKLRLHKRTMVQNEELQALIQSQEREKSNLILAKAAVEKGLQDLKNEIIELRSYKQGYKQIESERNDFERKYNDTNVELEGLRHAHTAQPDARTSQHSAVPAPSSMNSHTGVLKSYDEDLDLLEKYWNRQKHFAELAARLTAAELAGVEAQLTELSRRLKLLQGLDEGNEESGTGEDNSKPDDESDAALQSVGEDAQTRLLDTLAQPLRAGVSPAPSAGLQPAPSSQQLQTWASRVGTAPQHHTVDRAYTHVSYQGAGVFIVKEIRAPDSDGWQKVTRRQK
jgi:hypothetical protein